MDDGHEGLHEAWLTVLYVLLKKMRQFGNLAVEGDIFSPKESTIFEEHPKAIKEPYLKYASNIFGQFLNGTTDPGDIDIYINLAKRKPMSHRNVDISVLDCIGISLLMHSRGAEPKVAIQFAGQCVAHVKQSDPYALMQHFESVWAEYFIRHHLKPQEELDGAIDRFVLSLK
jgi:hypothetical protein